MVWVGLTGTSSSQRGEKELSPVSGTLSSPLGGWYSGEAPALRVPPPSNARACNSIFYGHSFGLWNHPFVGAKVNHNLLITSLCQALWRDVYTPLLHFENVQTYIKAVKIIQITPIDLDSSVHILPHLFYVSVYVFLNHFRMDYRHCNASLSKYFSIYLLRKRTYC